MMDTVLFVVNISCFYVLLNKLRKTHFFSLYPISIMAYGDLILGSIHGGPQLLNTQRLPGLGNNKTRTFPSAIDDLRRFGNRDVADSPYGILLRP